MTKLHLQNYPMSFSFLAMWAKSSLILRRQRSALSQRGSKRPRTSENQAKPNVAHLELVKFSSSQQGSATSQMGKRFYVTNLKLMSSCLIFDCKSSNTFDFPYAHNLFITFYTTYCNYIKGFNKILKQADHFSRLTDSIQKKLKVSFISHLIKGKKQLPSLCKIANTFCLLSLLFEKLLSPYQ